MIRSRHPRLILNEIKWRFDLQKCEIHYIHRGVPGNVRVAHGREIKNIERGFLVLDGVVDDVYIPYHRIIRIDYDTRTVFDRKKIDKLSKQ